MIEILEEVFSGITGSLPTSLESFLANPIIGPGAAFFSTFILFFVIGYAISWYKNYWRRRSELKTLNRLGTR